MSKKSATLARARQLACLGLPGGLFVAALLPLLRNLTASDSGAFFWLDEAGTVANFYADQFPFPANALPSTFAAFDSQGADLDSRSSPFRPASVSVLASTIDKERGASPWYNEILRCHGAHYILHGVARHEGVVLGRVTLFRSAERRAFGLAEIHALSDVIRYVAQGLRGVGTGVEDPPAGGEEVFEEEMVVADCSGRLIHATERARRLLLLSTGCALTPGNMSVAGRESHGILRALCAERSAATKIVRRTLWGNFVLRAFWLSDEVSSDGALVGVHIGRTQPASLRFVSAMSALPLSPQQREIALMIARGATNRDISGKLCVSVNTVAYHVKQLFYKLQVHDRAELLAKIKECRMAS